MILTEANKRNGEEERNRPIHCSGMPIMNEWMIERDNAFLNEWEWMREWMSEWESLNEWIRSDSSMNEKKTSGKCSI
jgi:hypothetical protein